MVYFAENTRLTFLYDPALGPPRHIFSFLFFCNDLHCLEHHFYKCLRGQLFLHERV